MKSAYELALERSGGKLDIVSDDVKNKLAEMDRICKAKIAEAELSMQRKIDKEEDPVKAVELKDALITEIASIRDKYERQKKSIRS